MMTVERKIVFGLSDIKAVIFECIKCKSRTALSPEEWKEPPSRCPAGHAWEWNVYSDYRSTESPFLAFLTSLRKLSELGSEKGFRIMLEIAEPEGASVVTGLTR